MDKTILVEVCKTLVEVVFGEWNQRLPSPSEEHLHSSAAMLLIQRLNKLLLAVAQVSEGVTPQIKIDSRLSVAQTITSEGTVTAIFIRPETRA